MEKHKLFTIHQHGFRKGRSCVTQLIEVLDDWTEQLDNKNAIDTIYLDFQKAFDTVPHQRLINKLQSYGICSVLSRTEKGHGIFFFEKGTLCVEFTKKGT